MKPFKVKPQKTAKNLVHIGSCLLSARSGEKETGQARISQFMNTYIWDLRDVGKPTASLCQTARYTTIVGHNFSPTKEKKKIQSWNKYHGKDIIIPFKSIISDGCEVAAIK